MNNIVLAEFEYLKNFRSAFFVLLLALFLCWTPTICYSQNPSSEKRIYILDVTASMEGKDDAGAIDIFEEVKEKLSNAVKSVESETGEFVVIPFTNKTHHPIMGPYTAKDSIAVLINDLKVKRGETNISAAWERGVQELDSTKVNYLFLLTDGIHNYGTSKDFLLSELRHWKELSDGKYFFAFYVMLTPNAHDSDIAKTIDETPQMWCIESMDVMVSFVTLPFYMKTNANVHGEKTFSFVPIARFKDSSPSIKIIMDENPYYSLENGDVNLGEGYLKFKLKEKLDHNETPLVCDLKLHFEYDRLKYPLLFFTPEEVTLKAVNRGTRTMNIRILD